MGYQLVMEIPFAEAKWAHIVQKAVGVEKEPRKAEISRKVEVQGNNLVVTFESSNLKLLRTASGGFTDLIALSCETLAEFS